MKKAINSVFLYACFAGALCGQSSFPALRVQGESVEQNAAAANGGYLVFRPMTYNPYDGSVCHDLWTNPVQQPVPASSSVTFGVNDALLWLSASPSMPFTSGTGPGLVQPITYNALGAAGPCGSPLPVNTNYGLNTNVYLFARGGLATDNGYYDSIQSLQGGVLAGSFTAGIWYPTGTTVCTSYNGSSCTATAAITAGLCPGGAVGCYLGGHVDVGHSVGPPASGGIGAVTNPYTGSEGAVAGQLYFDDGSGVYPTYLPCLRVYNGSSFGCAGDVSEVYNSFADEASSPTTTAAFQTHTGTFVIWGSGDAQFQTVKATSTFNSLATGTTAAVQQYTGTFKITGAGNAAFQSVALTNGITVDSGAYGLSAAGVLSVASCTGCSSGGVTSWNTRTGTVTLAAADVAAVEQDLRTSASPSFAAMTAATFNSTATGTTAAFVQASGYFQQNGDGKLFVQGICTDGTPSTEACTYGLTSAGVLSVASCTGCSSGGVTSWNTRTGTVTLAAADVAAVEQDLRTSASPSFAAMTAATFNSTATGTTAAFVQASGYFQQNGDGKLFVQGVCTDGTPSTEACTYGLTSAGVLTASSATLGNQGSAITGASGGALLSATTAGVFASVNAGAPSLLLAAAGGWTVAGTGAFDGTLYANGNLSVGNAIAVATGIQDAGYLQVKGVIEVGSGLLAGVTSTTCSQFTNGVCTAP